MYHYYNPINSIAQEAAMYELLANYYKYLDPQKHIYYYQMHFMCMQKLCHAHQSHGLGHMDRSPSHKETPAKVRVLHASPDAPAVDIYVNGEKTLENMMYYMISPYLDLPAGSYTIDVYPAGKTSGRVLSEKVMVEGGKNYTVAAAGQLKDIRLVPVVDSKKVPSTKSKVRFWHLSPNAPAVDIAVQDGDVLFKNIAFKEAAKYLELAPTTVNLEVRVAGTKDVVLTLRNTVLKANQAYTIVAIGLVDGKPRLEAMILQP